MWWKKAPFFRILPAFIIGIWVAWLWPIPFWVFYTLPSIGLILLFLNRLMGRYRGFTLSWLPGLGMQFIYLSFGIFFCFRHDPTSDPDWYGKVLKKNNAVLIRVLETPVEKTNSFQTRAVLVCAWQQGKQIKLKGKILVYFKKQDHLPAAGSLLWINKTIEPIRNSGNPGEFDFRAWCKLQGLSGSIYLEQKDLKKRMDESPGWVHSVLERTQIFIRSRLKKYIPDKKEYGLAEALLIGYRADLDKDLSTAYSNTGTVHIIAISGMHLALIYSLLMWLFGALPEKGILKWLRIGILLTTLWAFSFLCGGQPSVLRATISFSFIMLAKALNRHASTYNSLAGSAFILLCIDPYYLFDPGFQLSFAAISSILIFQRPIREYFKTENKFLGLVYDLVAITVAAQILTFPISAWHFHQFPTYFLFSNLLAVPISGIILIAEIILMAVCSIPALANICGKIISLLISLMNGWIEKVSELPVSSIKDIQINAWQMLLLFLIILFFSLFLFSKYNSFLWFGCASVLLFAALRGRSFSLAMQAQRFIVYNVKGESMAEYHSGRKAWAFFDPGSRSHELLRTSHSFYRIREERRVENSSYYLISAKSLVLATNYQLASDPMPDFLLLSGNAHLEIMSTAPTVKGLVIIDGSVPFSNMRKIRKQCDSLLLPVHVVREKGAFIIGL